MGNMEMIQKILMASIFEVFEKMFYIFLEPVEKEGEGDDMKASIYYTGPAEGVITARYSTSLSRSMARNMLNLEEDEITEKLITDCLKESVNMIGGNFLRKLAPSKVFDLSIPELSGFSTATDKSFAQSLNNKLEMNFQSGEGKLGVIYRFSPVDAESL